MFYKKFGRTENEVSLLGFGCWGIGKSLWIGAEDAESKKALHRAIDEGVNFFDTALVYGDGHSESLVGDVEKESGKTMFIATKVPSMKMEWPAKDESTLQESFPTDYIIKTTEQSLRNLKRDYVDVQQFHVWNDKWANQDEWKEAVYRLKKDGKVRYFGISINDHQPWNGIEAAKTGLIDSFQVIFNIFDQSPTDELLPFCAENNIAVIVRVPFDEGALTGMITPETTFPEGDFRNYYFRKERKAEVQMRVAEIQKDIQHETSTIAEAALRYLVSFNEVTTIIPGMRSEKNLLANINSILKGGLSPELLEQLKSHRWEKNYYK
ncbi:MAG TPA: aldo/keto reductase [Bacteroidetes bacterium]|nr:aldo/keto reductase [Bacteroidota bacterium]HRI46197.1 aldo/keto reductase [Ignavibacteriaceae bacterium]